MIRRWLATLVLAMVSLCTLIPTESQCAPQAVEEPATETPDDVQDLVFLSPSRPLLWRLHIAVNDQPIRDVWRFAAVSEEQSRQKPGDKPAMMKAPAKGSEESKPWFLIQQVATTSRSAAPALFSLLDVNGDGLLSAEEMGAARERLRARDFDDNGLVSALELLRDASIDETSAEPAALILPVDSRHPPRTIAKAILARYDRNSDSRLAARGEGAEILLSDKALAALDTDKDGFLDAEELAQFASRPADIEFEFQFGRGRFRASDRSQIEDDEFHMYRRLDGGYKLIINDARVVFNRNNRNPASADEQQFRFKPLDMDQNGYLDEKEVNAAPGLSGEFKSIDRDADGKVSPAELEAFVLERGKANASRLLLQVSDDGQDLFSMIDSDHDGFLSQRELQAAVELVKSRDVNGDGLLGASEIPQQLTLELTRGVTLREAQAAAQGPRAPTPRTPSVGPDWFRHMDRNGDGDVSRAEFLGTRAEFESLDRDHDGLISAVEAEQLGK